MTKQEINKLKEDQIPVVSTTDKGIHFSPRFVGLLADEVARTVVRTLPSFRRQGKGNSKKKKNNKPLDSAVFLDTSAIIDGRVFDVISLGLFRGNVVVLDSILLELKHIADSKDLVRRERGRKGLLLLEKVKKVKGIKLLILSAEKEKNMGVKTLPEVDEQAAKEKVQCAELGRATHARGQQHEAPRGAGPGSSWSSGPRASARC